MSHSWIKRTFFALLIAVLAAPVVVFAPPSLPSAQAQDDLNTQIDAFLTQLTSEGKFMGVVLVAKDGQIIFEKAYGYADLENEAPNTVDTRFEIASTTKPLTATLVMMLQDQGKLNVQDKICQYIPDCPEAWKDITIHHLLTHTSGIPDYYTFPDAPQFTMLPSTLEELVGRIKEKPLDFQPGETWAYCDSNFVLLSYIIEKVSGMPFPDFRQKYLFDALGMNNSGRIDYTHVIKHRAYGYLDASTRVPYADPSSAWGNGDVYTTVEDLYLFDQALYTDKLMPQATRDLMFTPEAEMPTDLTTALEPTVEGPIYYGYGWAISTKFGGHTRISHGGGGAGFNTVFSRYPDDKVTLIMLCNIGDFSIWDTVEVGVLKLVFGEQ